MAYLQGRFFSSWQHSICLSRIPQNKYKIMVTKEEEKNYTKPKISKIWNFLIYGSTIAIGLFLVYLYSIYIFINK